MSVSVIDRTSKSTQQRNYCTLSSQTLGLGNHWEWFNKSGVHLQHTAAERFLFLIQTQNYYSEVTKNAMLVTLFLK